MEEEITIGNNRHNKENQDEMETVNPMEKEKVVNTLIPRQSVRNVRLVKTGKSQVSNDKMFVSAKKQKIIREIACAEKNKKNEINDTKVKKEINSSSKLVSDNMPDIHHYNNSDLTLKEK